MTGTITTTLRDENCVVEYRFEKGEKARTTGRMEDCHPGSKPGVEILSATISGVDYADNLTGGEREDLEAECLDDALAEIECARDAAAERRWEALMEREAA